MTLIYYGAKLTASNCYVSGLGVVKGVVIMTNRKTVCRLILGLVCSAVIVWLGVGCGEAIDPDYPCGEDAILHAEHVREVLKENRRLFRRQPGFGWAMEHFIRDEQGNWSDEYGIVILVQENVDQDTLPPEDRVPDEIDGVTVYFDEVPRNYTGGLIERIYFENPELQYTRAVKFKYIDLLRSHPDFDVVLTGPWKQHGHERGERGVHIYFYKKVDPSTLPWDGRMPECLEGVPVILIESKSN